MAPIVGAFGLATAACSGAPDRMEIDRVAAALDERMLSLMEAASVPGLTIAVVEETSTPATTESSGPSWPTLRNATSAWR